MSDKDKTQNRSLSCCTNFRPLEKSIASIKAGQIYGPISTPSYVTCDPTNPVDYRVLLNTSASVDHCLFPEFVYTVPGKILLLNTPAPPMLNYFMNLVTKVCRVTNEIEDSNNKAFTSGLGLVILIAKPAECDDEEIKTNKKPELIIEVSHTDWDPTDRMVKSFNVKYVIPANPKLINTHSMIRIGREFFFDGYLAGWDLKQRMAIIEVVAVSPVGVSTTGSGPKLSTSTPQPSPSNKGRRFFTFEENDLDSMTEPHFNSKDVGSSRPGPSAQGESISEPSIQTPELPSSDEFPLALSSNAKGKAKAVEPSSPSKKKRGAPGL